MHENALQDVSMVRSRATIKTESCAGGVHSGYQVELQSAQQVEALQQFRGCSSVGRAVVLHTICRWFDSSHFHQFYGSLAEWLRQQFAKLSLRKRCASSNLARSAKQKSQLDAGFFHYCAGHASRSVKASLTHPSASFATSPYRLAHWPNSSVRVAP